MGEAGAEQGDREPELRGAVDCREQGAEFFVPQVLEFVDGERQRRVGSAGSGPAGLQEFGQVVLEVAAVGETGLEAQVDLEGDVSVMQLHGPNEAAQRAKGAPGGVGGSSLPAQFEQRGAQGGRQQAGQRRMLRRLEKDGGQASRLRVSRDAVEQDRLARTAKSEDDQALGREPGTRPVQGYRGLPPAVRRGR